MKKCNIELDKFAVSVSDVSKRNILENTQSFGILPITDQDWNLKNPMNSHLRKMIPKFDVIDQRGLLKNKIRERAVLEYQALHWGLVKKFCG